MFQWQQHWWKIINEQSWLSSWWSSRPKQFHSAYRPTSVMAKWKMETSLTPAEVILLTSTKWRQHCILANAPIILNDRNVKSGLLESRWNLAATFLSCISILTRNIDIAHLSVCSGIRWKQLNISSQFFSPYSSPIILLLPASNIFTKFWQGSPHIWALNTGGVYKFPDLRPISR